MLDSQSHSTDALHLREAMDQMIDAVVIIGSANEIVYFNAAAEALWQYRRAEVLGQNVKMLIPRDMRRNHDSWVDRHRREQTNRIVGSSREVKLERKDGKQLWVSLGLSQMSNGSGETHYVAMVRDITDERMNRNVVEQILMQTADAVVSIDQHNNVTVFNPAAERMWGYSADEVLGNNVKMLVPPMMQHKHDGFVASHRETGQDRIVGTSRVVAIHCKDGAQKHARLTIRQIMLDGSAKHYTAFLCDVTSKSQVLDDTLASMRALLDEIANLTVSIKTMAQQTNLLSVNASIEAVRAGDMGRGFGVVATEIRALSNKARESTVKIENVVETGRESVAKLSQELESTQT